MFQPTVQFKLGTLLFNFRTMQKDNSNGKERAARELRDVLADALMSNPRPQFLTLAQYRKLLINGYKARSEPDFEPKPVVKLFTPDAWATWLISEIDPLATDIAFGLCDLGIGHPELGSLSLQELTDLRWHLGLPVERDRTFKATKSLTAYADDARSSGSLGA